MTWRWQIQIQTFREFFNEELPKCLNLNLSSFCQHLQLTPIKHPEQVGSRKSQNKMFFSWKKLPHNFCESSTFQCLRIRLVARSLSSSLPAISLCWTVEWWWKRSNWLPRHLSLLLLHRGVSPASCHSSEQNLRALPRALSHNWLTQSIEIRTGRKSWGSETRWHIWKKWCQEVRKPVCAAHRT